MTFNSQICTTREQSQRLLSLGLKKETADMGWGTITLNGEPITFSSEDSWDNNEITEIHIPAWSLHRLIEMMPAYVHGQGWISIGKCGLHYSRGYGNVSGDGLYSSIINCIEWLIKEKRFPKEYLEE